MLRPFITSASNLSLGVAALLACSCVAAETTAPAKSTGPLMLAGPLTQWKEDQGGNDHYYQAIAAPAGTDWKSAQAWAVTHGGYLATIASEEENKFVFKLIDSPKYWVANSRYGGGPYLGGIKSPEVGWHWVDNGETFGCTKWAPNQPGNKDSIEDRLQFFSTLKQGERQPLWNDCPGDAKSVVGFVVEYNNSTKAAPAAKNNAGLDRLFAVRFAVDRAQEALKSATVATHGGFVEKGLTDLEQAQAQIAKAMGYFYFNPEANDDALAVSPKLDTIRKLIQNPAAQGQRNMRDTLNALTPALKELQKIPGDAGGYLDGVVNALLQAATNVDFGMRFAAKPAAGRRSGG